MNLKDFKIQPKKRTEALRQSILYNTSLYLFFAVYFLIYPESMTFKVVAGVLMGLLCFANFGVTIGLIVFLKMIKNPEGSLIRDEQATSLVRGMIECHYRCKTWGYYIEKGWLYLVTVPYYLVVAFVFMNLPLLLLLFWSRLNMVVFENVQKYYYWRYFDEIQDKDSPSIILPP